MPRTKNSKGICFLCKLPDELLKEVIKKREQKKPVSYREIAKFLEEKGYPISFAQLSKMYPLHMKEHYQKEIPAKIKAKIEHNLFSSEIPPELLNTILERRMSEKGFSFEKIRAFLSENGFNYSFQKVFRHWKKYEKEVNEVQANKVETINPPSTSIRASPSYHSFSNNTLYQEHSNKRKEYEAFANRKISFKNQPLSTKMVDEIIAAGRKGLNIVEIADLYIIKREQLLSWFAEGKKEKNYLTTKLHDEYYRAFSALKAEVLGSQVTNATVGDIFVEEVHTREEIVTPRGEVIPVAKSQFTSRIKGDPKSRDAVLKRLKEKQSFNEKILEDIQKGEKNPVEASVEMLRNDQDVPEELKAMIPKAKIDPPANQEQLFTEEELEEEELETLQHILHERDVVIPERKQKIEELKKELNQDGSSSH